MGRVDVNPELIQWAVTRAGGSDLFEGNFPKLTEWLRKESNPTLKQLEKLAKATAVPLGYFFLSEPPHEEITIPQYRTVGDEEPPQPSPDLIDTLHTMEKRQDWMRDYLRELGNEPLLFVGSAKLTDNPEVIADKMKKKLGLANGWASECSTWEQSLRFLINTIEKIGVLVAVNGIVGNNTHRKLDVNEFRGFVLVDEYAPLIFINGADGKAAQMFTLAHELAHIWYGKSGIFDLKQLQPSNDEIEKDSNQTAAEFLVPKQEMIQIWSSIKNDQGRFQQVARQFKVSELVVARRALDLNLITGDEYFQFYNSRSKVHEQNGTRGNFYATQNQRIGRRFAEAVISEAKSGRLLYRDAYRLTGLTGKTFEEFAKRLEEG